MQEEINNSKLVAAIDLGSNSFHMIVAKMDESGTLLVIDRIREPVRLGGGLTTKGKLKKDARERAIACLEMFAQRVISLPKGSVRVVGTNTLRVAKNAKKFVNRAEQVLGHPIDVIAGREEARLIYLGVAHGREAKEGKRLVVDIGGGSTELIIGEGLKSHKRESMWAGCVSASNRFFADGSITADAMKKAVMNTRLTILPVTSTFISSNWDEALGCSGTIKAIRNIVQAEGWADSGITYESLKKLRDVIISAGHMDKLELETLSDDRKPVLAGGLAVLLGVFKELKIESMRVSDQSLREGLLYDLVGRLQHTDVRALTVQSATKRWGIDQVQANNVAQMAQKFFDAVADSWDLNEEHRNMLSWAAQLHEIGLQVSHNRYHRHGAYILANADFPGFSRQEQALLAILVKNHRRKYRPKTFVALVKSTQKVGMKLCVLLRLAVLIYRGRSTSQVPEISTQVMGKNLALYFPEDWLEQHPLTQADLAAETEYLDKAGFKLVCV